MKTQLDLEALSPWVAAFGVTPETRLATPKGEVAAADLVVGDVLQTRDHGPRAITNIRQAFAAPTDRNHYPVRIAQGAMGFGLPRADLALGPQHRVLFEHIRVPLMFGADAVLVRAKSLVATHAGVRVKQSPIPTSYIQISMADQCVVYAEGLPIETILPDGECELPFQTIRSWELMAAVA